MITIGDIPVLSATVEKPQYRNWWADVDVDIAAASPAVGARVVVGGLSGTVKARASYGNRTTITVAGGAGGLSRVLGSRHYSGQIARSVVALDVLREADETSAGSALSDSVAAWTRQAGTASSALDAIAGVWRVRDDGLVWLGAEPAVAARPPTVLDWDRDLGIRRFLADDLSLQPGVTLDGILVTRVRYIITAKDLTGYWWE